MLLHFDQQEIAYELVSGLKIIMITFAVSVLICMNIFCLHSDKII